MDGMAYMSQLPAKPEPRGQGDVSGTGTPPAKGANMAISPKDASKASKILSNPKSSKDVKSVAASDLAQAKGTGKGKK